MIKLIKYIAGVCLEYQRMLNPHDVYQKEMTLHFEVILFLIVGLYGKHGAFSLWVPHKVPGTPG